MPTTSTNNTRPTFTNVDARDPKKVKRYSTDTLVASLVAIGEEWPKLIGEALTVRRQDGKLAVLTTPAELFGWLNSFCNVVWSKQGMSREDLFAALAFHPAVERFDGISDHPHFPRRLPGICYTRGRPKAEKTGMLDKLLDRFTVATPHDREFLRAAIITPYHYSAALDDASMPPLLVCSCGLFVPPLVVADHLPDMR